MIRLEKKSNIGRATQCYNFLALFPYKIVIEKQSDGVFALNKNRKSQFLSLGSSTNFLVLYENQHFRSMGICQHKFQILYFERSPRNKHAYPCPRYKSNLSKCKCSQNTRRYQTCILFSHKTRIEMSTRRLETRGKLIMHLTNY